MTEDLLKAVSELGDAVELRPSSQADSGTAGLTEGIRGDAKEQARQARNKWEQDVQSYGLLVNDHELGRAFLRKRKAAYMRAADTVKCLRKADRLERSKECYLDFYQLYWGGLLIVEDQDVIHCMVSIGGIGGPLVQWAQGTNADDNPKAKFDKLATRFVGMLRDQKIPQINECLSNTGPIDESCFSFKANSYACLSESK